MENISFITDLVTPVGLAVIMFGMGMTLTLQDFKKTFIHPKPVIIGILLQIVGLPLLGLVFIYVMHLNPMLAVAVMLISACPGGSITSLVTNICKGDTALAVSLSVINSIIIVFTLPIIVISSISGFMGQAAATKINVLSTTLGIVFLTLVPIIIGMIVRNKAPRFANKISKPIRTCAMLFLFGLVAILSVYEWPIITANAQSFALIAACVCVVSAVVGILIALLFHMTKGQVLTLGIQTGIHNSGIALVVATTFLKIPELSIFASFYLIFEYIVAILFMLIFGSLFSRKKNPQPADGT